MLVLNAAQSPYCDHLDTFRWDEYFIKFYFARRSTWSFIRYCIIPSLAHPQPSHKGHLRMEQMHCLMLLMESKFSSTLSKTWPTRICYFSTAGWHFLSLISEQDIWLSLLVHCSGTLPHCVPYSGCYSGKLSVITLSSLPRTDCYLMHRLRLRKSTLWPTVHLWSKLPS